MDFTLSAAQLSWKEKALSLGRDLPNDVAPTDLIARAGQRGLLDVSADLDAVVVAVETIAEGSAAAAMVFAMHVAVLLAEPLGGRSIPGNRIRGISLSSEQMPIEAGEKLSGRAWWVGPATEDGVAIVGAKRGSELVAAAVALDAPRVQLEAVKTAALQGFPCAHVNFDGTPCAVLGSPRPIMAGVRVLLAAVGLGMGRRALKEALHAAHAYSRTGAGGEQTVQGLLADAATELDAAALLTWKATQRRPISLADASMAKLAATEATQRAVARATQVVGSDSFRDGHVVERLAQDVRALELFAGRTEALREAVADEVLPRP